MRNSHLWQVLTELGGVASRAELLRMGVSRGTVTGAVASGRLLRLETGLFAHPAADPTDLHFRRRRALAWAGPLVLLSHEAAATIWDVSSRESPTTIPVSVPHGRRIRPLPGVEVHQWAGWIHSTRSGWPVTTIKQTLVGLATRPGPHTFRFAALAATNSGVISKAEFSDTTGVPSNVRGRWNEVVAEVRAGAESGGEGLYWRLIHESPLPDPLLNVPIACDGAHYRLDASWPDFQLAAEIDGQEHHAHELAFTSDRIRQNRLHAHGLLVIRFTVAQVLNEPGTVLRLTDECLRIRAQQLHRPVTWRAPY